jgi:hypothetical protein
MKYIFIAGIAQSLLTLAGFLYLQKHEKISGASFGVTRMEAAAQWVDTRRSHQ